ncbi:RagB/SusD family nutrient uptake outer membrane protein [Alkaliflexus imshenetskii]|uniref:RagB/SusD family nutrient uptake outer membrane protein n=1 Tax=Alkaliflexus imshenetskii TaxID=286730 RepID=UPI0004B58FEF|nr:RagB/SusD family nutrient uptake outer membrane protein [Alkaliflexus imshenetskii]
MMNKIKYLAIIFLAISGLYGLNSCSDELNVDPTAELEGDFYNSEQRMQQGVGACYAMFANLYGPVLNDPGMHAMFMLPGDDISNFDSGNAAFAAFSGLNESNGQVTYAWRRYYQLLYRCNFMLEKLEEEEVKALYRRDGLWQANKGEVLFLRAWAYYRLYDWFGKAPLQDKRIPSIGSAILPPSEGTQMLDKAISDLNLAVELLPNVNYWTPATEKGRVWNESAYGLLVRAHVLRARHTKNANGDYAKAITAFGKITSRELVTFHYNFSVHHENNKESLFEFQASSAPAMDNAWLDNDFDVNIGQMGAQYHYFTNHWGNYMSGKYGPSLKLRNAFEDGDPRKAETFAPIFTNVNGNVNVPQPYPSWDKFGGNQMQKYVKPGHCEFERDWGLSSPNNYRLMRYADIKLLAAEAYLQTNQPALALKEVNDIRERARRSTPDGSISSVPADLTAVTMQDIMDERLRELAGEDGIRWTDLRSWHRAGYIDLSTWTASDFGFEFDAENFRLSIPTHLLFPIPKRELDTNPLMAASGNNPGY